ncbi:MAG: HAD family hydrolase [Methyloligellaceae bacterium]
MKSAVIFDMGGVLIDWDPRHLYRKLIPDEQAMEVFLANVCHHEWQEKQNDGRPWAEAIAERVALYPEHRDLIEAYWQRWPETMGGAIDGTVATLDALRGRGIRLYGLTNWSAETFPFARQRFEFLDWFEGIVVSGEVGMRKPSPEIFAHLFEQFGLDPADAVFVDDHMPNIEGARSLGLESHFFTSAENLRSYLKTVRLL